MSRPILGHGPSAWVRGGRRCARAPERWEVGPGGLGVVPAMDPITVPLVANALGFAIRACAGAAGVGEVQLKQV